MGTSDTEQDCLDLHGSAGFYRHVFVMERIGTTVRDSTVPDILILRTALFPTIFYFSSVDKMPAGIMLMGITFNLLNGYMQGEWIFYLAPQDMYTKSWLHSPQFIVGTILFFTGMAINIQSDHIVRHLRKPGDTNHYLPKKGLFKYVTSANYFGEIVEWCGFAILTWSASGAVFAWWTFANLVPRANTIYHKYKAMFGNELENRKRVIPFIY